jgi:hypothetical protein
MTIPKRRILSRKESFEVATRLTQLWPEIEARRIPADEIAEMLAEELGYPITRYQIRHLAKECIGKRWPLMKSGKGSGNKADRFRFLAGEVRKIAHYLTQDNMDWELGKPNLEALDKIVRGQPWY